MAKKKRSVPSPSAAFRYLSNFHNPEQEEIRETATAKAFIPVPNGRLNGLEKINTDIFAGLNLVNAAKLADAMDEIDVYERAVGAP